MCHGCGLQAAASRINLRMGTESPFPVGRGTWGQSVTLSGMIQNTNLLEGRHALASPKGVISCPLSTLDHMVVGHLVF